jgi:signal transduction histidine kinase
MNARSLKFQLITWYAGVLTGCFLLLAAATCLVLQTSLVGALRENQLRRARQIGELVRQESQQGGEGKVGQEVDVRYAPALNDRFVRISQRDGAVIYLSPAPTNQDFDPAVLPPPIWPQGAEAFRQVPLMGGRKMLLTAHALQLPGSDRFLIETGAPMDSVHADLKKWLLFLAAMLPVVLAIAVGGGFVLVERALSPVDRITASAERISSQNLSERLPIPRTGDEFERLSLALNRMIEGLDSAFSYSRRFVADASHELRTPLTVLQGELESLVQDSYFTPDARERMGSALEEVDRLAHIVEGLFAISRLDVGEAASEWVPIDLAQLVTATADQMSLLAEDKAIQVDCDAVMGVWVQGDRARVKQVVVNLLDNAIKYTPPGGTVTLSVACRDNLAVFEIADTGIGIPSEALDKIFERFFRVDPARSHEQGGAGLGLSIVKSICTAHHGRIEVSSRPGEGSRFRVELPLLTTRTDQRPLQNTHDYSDV